MGLLVLIGVILAATSGEDATSCGGEQRTDLDTSTTASCNGWDAFHKAIHKDSSYCESCHANEDLDGKKQLEKCCTKACNCDDMGESIGTIIIGIVVGVIGLIMVCAFSCGIFPCCCYGKDAAPAPRPPQAQLFRLRLSRF